MGCAGVSTASIPPPTRGLCCRAWWFSLAKNNATCVQEPGVPLTCQSVPPAFYTHPPRNNSCSVIMCTIKNGEGPEDQITHLTTLKKKEEEEEDSKHTTSDQVAIIQKLLLKNQLLAISKISYYLLWSRPRVERLDSSISLLLTYPCEPVA